MHFAWFASQLWRTSITVRYWRTLMQASHNAMPAGIVTHSAAKQDCKSMLLVHIIYVYHGRLRIQRMVYPESTRILIDAASAARTVSRTDCIKFCALPTSISVASWSSSEPASQTVHILTRYKYLTIQVQATVPWKAQLMLSVSQSALRARWDK